MEDRVMILVPRFGAAAADVRSSASPVCIRKNAEAKLRSSVS